MIRLRARTPRRLVAQDSGYRATRGSVPLERDRVGSGFIGDECSRRDLIAVARCVTRRDCRARGSARRGIPGRHRWRDCRLERSRSGHGAGVSPALRPRFSPSWVRDGRANEWLRRGCRRLSRCARPDDRGTQRCTGLERHDDFTDRGQRNASLCHRHQIHRRRRDVDGKFERDDQYRRASGRNRPGQQSFRRFGCGLGVCDPCLLGKRRPGLSRSAAAAREWSQSP